MLDGPALRAALTTCPRVAIAAAYYRSVDNVYAGSVLSALGSLRMGGRYNVKSSFEALYVAPDPVVALAEVEAIVMSGPRLVAVKMPPRLMVTVEVDLRDVLDLSVIAVRRKLATTLTELKQPWKPFVLAGRIAPTQLLGAAIRDAGFEGLVAPSARVRGASNLVVFPSNLYAASSYRVFAPGPLGHHTVSGTRFRSGGAGRTSRNS